MPRAKTICDICCGEVIETETNTEDALFCEGVCQKWIHRRCAGVTREHFEKLSLMTPGIAHAVLLYHKTSKLTRSSVK